MRYYHKTRKSYYHAVNHLHDNKKNLGYDYNDKIIKSMISPEIYSNPFQKLIIDKLESIVNFYIEEIKTIKKQYSIAHDKKDNNIN